MGQEALERDSNPVEMHVACGSVSVAYNGMANASMCVQYAVHPYAPEGGVKRLGGVRRARKMTK
jgi:hypothetical protein